MSSQSPPVSLPSSPRQLETEHEPDIEPEPEPPTHTHAVIKDDGVPFYPVHTRLHACDFPAWEMGVTGDVQDCHVAQVGMVYILVCGAACEYIYVGYVTSSGSVRGRISLHVSRAASKLTRRHPVQYCRQTVYPATKQTERDVTRWLAQRCPAHKVRGAAYCDPDKPTPWGK